MISAAGETGVKLQSNVHSTFHIFPTHLMRAAFKNLWLISGYLLNIFVTGRPYNPEKFHVTRIKRRRNVGCEHKIGIHIF